MADKKENIKIFKHTQELIGKNKTLQDSIKYSIENSDFLADNMTVDFFFEKKNSGNCQGYQEQLIQCGKKLYRQSGGS